MTNEERDEMIFRNGFYAGAQSEGWSDADAAGCDIHKGRECDEAVEKERARPGSLLAPTPGAPVSPQPAPTPCPHWQMPGQPCDECAAVQEGVKRAPPVAAPGALDLEALDIIDMGVAMQSWSTKAQRERGLAIYEALVKQYPSLIAEVRRLRSTSPAPSPRAPGVEALTEEELYTLRGSLLAEFHARGLNEKIPAPAPASPSPELEALITTLGKVCTYIEGKEDTRPYSDLTPGMDLHTEVLFHIADLVKFRDAAPASPIEKAAREAVQDLIVTCDTVELYGGDDVLITYLRPQLEIIRASLAGPPGDGGKEGEPLAGLGEPSARDMRTLELEAGAAVLVNCTRDFLEGRRGAKKYLGMALTSMDRCLRWEEAPQARPRAPEPAPGEGPNPRNPEATQGSQPTTEGAKS